MKTKKIMRGQSPLKEVSCHLREIYLLFFIKTKEKSIDPVETKYLRKKKRKRIRSNDLTRISEKKKEKRKIILPGHVSARIYDLGHCAFIKFKKIAFLFFYYI